MPMIKLDCDSFVSIELFGKHAVSKEQSKHPRIPG